MSLRRRAFVAVLAAHAAIYERSGGLIGHRLIGLPTLLLRTTGAKSGQPRVSALVYAKDGDRWLVVPSNGGARRASDPRAAAGGAWAPSPLEHLCELRSACVCGRAERLQHGVAP